MILQLKQGGSWSNVCKFDGKVLSTVQSAAEKLLAALELSAALEGLGQPEFRVIARAAKSPKVLYRLESAAADWEAA